LLVQLGKTNCYLWLAATTQLVKRTGKSKHSSYHTSASLSPSPWLAALASWCALITVCGNYLQPEMGACYCRPQTLVTEDPDVNMYTEVGYCVLMGRYPGDFQQLSRYGGLAYVKNTGHLCVESTVGSRFCCLCCRHGWAFSDISQVEVVTGSVTVSVRNRYGTTHHTHNMNPGLGVILANGDKIAMQMPDAVNFCARLRQYCNLPSAGQILLENMLWQAVLGGRQNRASGRAPVRPGRRAPGGLAPVRPGTLVPSRTLSTVVPEESQALIS
jgi:hypothetical protein